MTYSLIKVVTVENMFKKKLDSNTIPNNDKSNLIDGRFKKLQRDLEELKLLVEKLTNSESKSFLCFSLIHS